eukprot:scaffold109965_cov28-Tisochrysis_lutea.AAC.2
MGAIGGAVRGPGPWHIRGGVLSPRAVELTPSARPYTAFGPCTCSGRVVIPFSLRYGKKLNPAIATVCYVPVVLLLPT